MGACASAESGTEKSMSTSTSVRLGSPVQEKPMGFEPVNGVLLPQLSAERWKELKNYPLRTDDLFIVAYPRSGTTWAEQIVRLLRNGGRSDEKHLDLAVPWMEVLGTPYPPSLGFGKEIADNMPSPRAFKSRFPYSLIPGGLPHTTQAKYIYIARNPKDVVVSYWYFGGVVKNKFILSNFEELARGVLEGSKSPYGNWFDHVLEWWKHREDANILFLKYEDMKKDPRKTVIAIARFIGLEGATDELIDEVVQKSSFSFMKSDPTTNHGWTSFPTKADFLRKGTIGDWKEHFTTELSADFDKVYTEKLAGTGLGFDFEM